MTTPETYITTAIKRAVETELSKIGEEEIAKCQAAIAKRMREKLGEIVLGVNQFYSMERREGHLVITVKGSDLT